MSLSIILIDFRSFIYCSEFFSQHESFLNEAGIPLAICREMGILPVCVFNFFLIVRTTQVGSL